MSGVLGFLETKNAYKFHGIENYIIIILIHFTDEHEQPILIPHILINNLLTIIDKILLFFRCSTERRVCLVIPAEPSSFLFVPRYIYKVRIWVEILVHGIFAKLFHMNVYFVKGYSKNWYRTIYCFFGMFDDLLFDTLNSVWF